MRPLHETLNSLRKSLGYTYEDVQEKLAKRGIDVSASTVGHWFTGIRSPRSLKVLGQLCEVLESRLAQVLDGHVEYARNDRELLLLTQFRNMTSEQRAAYIVMGTSITPDQSKDKTP